MFRPGKILQIGGNSSAAAVIDINGTRARRDADAGDVDARRQWVTATVLPDGRVLGTGGSAVENQLTGVNNRAEIWNPDDRHVALGTAGVQARLYHSSRAAAAGRDRARRRRRRAGAASQHSTPRSTTRRICSTRPARSLRARRSCRRPSRPTVGEHPVAREPRATSSRVTLVKTGSMTHSVNMDQRFVELPFTQSGASALGAAARARDRRAARLLHAVRARLERRAVRPRRSLRINVALDAEHRRRLHADDRRRGRRRVQARVRDGRNARWRARPLRRPTSTRSVRSA